MIYVKMELTDSMGHSPPSEVNSYSIKKFTASYVTRRFITLFTRARHWSLSSDQPTECPLTLFL